MPLKQDFSSIFLKFVNYSITHTFVYLLQKINTQQNTVSKNISHTPIITHTYTVMQPHKGSKPIIIYYLKPTETFVPPPFLPVLHYFYCFYFSPFNG